MIASFLVGPRRRRRCCDVAIRLIPDSTATPLVPSVTPSALGLDMTGRGGVSLDVHHARLLQQVFQKLEEKGRRDGEKAQAA